MPDDAKPIPELVDHEQRIDCEIPEDPHSPDFQEMMLDVVKTGEVMVLAQMLNEGGDVNITDRHGMSLLHYAAAKGARGCIRMLVGLGKCDYLIRDNQGRLPSDIAFLWGRDYAVARLLAKHEKRQANALAWNPFADEKDRF